MKLSSMVCIIGCLTLWATSSAAYEPITHGKISDEAAQQSVLVVPLTVNSTTILQDLDLSTYTDANQTFRNIQAASTIPTDTDPFVVTTPLSITNLIQAGAQQEDNGFRPLNHFYDPSHNIPLTLGGQVGYTAPDWALHDKSCSTYSSSEAYDPSGDGGSWSNQCFSLQDALAYYQNALTNSDPDVRNHQFGNLFLTLGHVMHVLQDMAQPQHVRNDSHCDVLVCQLFNTPLGNASRYERTVYNTTLPLRDFSSFATYPVVSLPTAQTYWSTVGTAYAGAGAGLADFTNSNFVSAGSNFVSLAGSNLPIALQEFSSPAPNGVYTESIDTVYGHFNQTAPPDLDAYCATLQAPLTCDVTLVESQMVDANDGVPSCTPDPQLFLDTACENANASSYSIFEPDLATVNANQAETYTLNDDNIQSAMNYLLPRAIGYSAGLINYFFRGRLGVDLDTEIPGNYVVVNTSNYAFSNGTLQVFYDFTNPSTGKLDRRQITGITDSDGRNLDNLTNNLSLDAANCSGSCNNSISISIPPAQTPTPANPGQYMFVFKGTIGTEPGVAGYSFTSRRGPGLMLNWANDNPNRLTRLYNFDASGNLEDNDFVVGDGSGFLTLEIAEYHGDAITTDGANVYTDLGVGTLYPIGPCGLNARQVGGVAVNDYGVYVTTIYNCPADGATQQGFTFDHFDFMGNKISSIPDTSFLGYTNDYGNNYSANDTEICAGNTIIKLDPNDPTHNVVQSPITLPLTGAAGDTAVDCAVTSNRIYVLTVNLDSTGAPTGPAFILVFDTDGHPILDNARNPIIIPDIAGSGDNYTMAATDTDIYLLQPGDATPPVIYDYIRKVTRSQDQTRTIQSEIFTRGPDIPLTGHTGLSQAVVVDMLYVLDGPTQ